MNDWAYKIGLRLLQIGYVRRAIDDRANLDAFKERPTFRIFLGVFLICFSFAMCWPVISALPVLAIYFKHAWILIFGPIIYGLSHLCFLAGMALSGEKYSRIVFRWMTRVGVEHLLSRATNKADQSPVHKS